MTVPIVRLKTGRADVIQLLNRGTHVNAPRTFSFRPVLRYSDEKDDVVVVVSDQRFDRSADALAAAQGVLTVLTEHDSLASVVREYLKLGSLDGRVERQGFRRAMAILADERTTSYPPTYTTKLWAHDGQWDWSVCCGDAIVGIGSDVSSAAATTAANRALTNHLTKGKHDRTT